MLEDFATAIVFQYSLACSNFVQSLIVLDLDFVSSKRMTSWNDTYFFSRESLEVLPSQFFLSVFRVFFPSRIRNGIPLLTPLIRHEVNFDMSI